MAGLYIHVPFCRQACRYCDFFFNVSLQYREAFIRSLLKEIETRSKELSGKTVDTIYLGGGTPSVLSIPLLRQVLSTIHTHYEIDDRAEITLEANPDDLSAAYLQDLRKEGFNRLSIGIQSYREKDLELMRRSHTVRQAQECINEAERKGFSNISMDLIYGIPGLSLRDWEQNIKIALEQPIKHLSAYHLTFEPGTVFHHWRKKGKIREMEEDDSIGQYALLREMTAAAGFEHYEISNFCTPGNRSRHNTTYWNGKAYLGLGPSAHSYNQKERRWNVSNLKRYIEGWDKGNDLHEKEELNISSRFNEYLITSLRTSDGIDLEKILKEFGQGILDHLITASKSYIEIGEIRMKDNSMKILPEAWFRSDMIIESLMLEA